MCIAVGGQHLDTGVSANERMAYGEGLLLFGDVVQRVGRGSVDKVGQVRAKGVGWRGDNWARERGRSNEVRLLTFCTVLAFCLIPHA